MRTSEFFYAALLFSGVAFADAPLDVTIKVLESPHELPDAVTKTIELPPRAAEVAREQAQPGLDRANEMRAQEPGQPGLDRASQARPQGRDVGQPMAEEARNQGNRGNAVPGRRPNRRGRP